MLGLTDILVIIKTVLQFPATMLEFVKLVRKTPAEQHEDLLKRLSDEQKKFEETGRPTWS
jgi:hypothetical protein